MNLGMFDVVCSDYLISLELPILVIKMLSWMIVTRVQIFGNFFNWKETGKVIDELNEIFLSWEAFRE